MRRGSPAVSSPHPHLSRSACIQPITTILSRPAAAVAAATVNCLQELAFAIQCNKPVAVIVLDQEAWDLLTLPNGAETAWSMDRWGAPLKEHDGQELVAGQGDTWRLSLKMVQRLFGFVAGINMCPGALPLSVDGSELGLNRAGESCFLECLSAAPSILVLLLCSEAAGRAQPRDSYHDEAG